MKAKTILLILLFFTSLAFTQEPELKPVIIDESPVGFLGMVQDKYGYIWLADNGNGLFKYDGKKTVHYKPIAANPNSVASGRIEDVIIDKDGIHWLVHFEAGLDRFDSETNLFTHYVHNELDSTSICSNATRDIIEDLDGNLWVGTASGVDRFDKKTGKFIHNFSNDPDAAILRKEHIRKMYLDKSGIIWIGTGSAFFGEGSTGGLFSLNPSTGEIDIYRHSEQENSLIDNRVSAMFEDSKGTFWVGTAGDGLHSLNRETGTITRHTYDPEKPNKLSRPPNHDIFSFGVDHITFIGEDDEENLWVGTFGNGMIRYNPQIENMDHYGPNQLGKFKTDNASFWQFLKTDDGLMWFATFSGGVNGIKLYRKDNVSQKLDFIKIEGISAGKEDANGTFYIGKSDGVYILNNREIENVFHIFNSKENEEHKVVEISFDTSGNIWAGTEGAGLFYYDIKTKVLKNYRHEHDNSNSLLNDYIGSILIQENGELYIGTAAGLDIFDPLNHQFEHFELANVNFTSDFFKYGKIIVKDGQNRIWVGGMGGIFRFERDNGAFIKYDLGYGSQTISNLFIDVKGELWITTINHGLRRYHSKTDTFKSVIDESGLLTEYSTLHSMSQDGNNELWIGAYNGNIMKYNIDNNQSTLYTNNWFSGNKQLDVRAIGSLSNGEILIGGHTGFVKFDPTSFKRPIDEVKKPFIEKLIVGNETLNSENDLELYNSFRNQSSVVLPYDQNDIRFKIGYIDFENIQDNQPVIYKLENYDKEWRTTSSGNIANYYQLPPGKYSLNIKAQDIYGNWGAQKLSIEIIPPWYFTIWAYILYALLFISAVILVHRFQKSRLLKKAQFLSKEKELKQAKKIKKAYQELGIAHNDLKATQSQLIQSEKMASLGELTAGIAHEIQNPLNFVNNFSEVSEELIEELKEGIKNNSKQDIDEILKNLNQNLGKINHHGKRASSIVKGMLDHSRTSKGIKVLTDMNLLADEYLRLSYHGLRAKDRTFSADFKTDLDNSIPKIAIVPQDFGRVVLNLINNAFYAVHERRKQSNDHYEPKVTVATKKIGEHIEITVKDNGFGISKALIDKIFQPFFTTKPTGQGTGLGLSLSYDIIKAHGGQLTVKSEEGVFTEFTIVLPLKTNLK